MNYLFHYQRLIFRAKFRHRNPNDYYEKHHVIPKCLGGTDLSDNLVYLTAEEHYTAHLLLVKLYPNQPRLIHAARMMTVSSKFAVRNNKQYGWLKRKYLEICKTRTGSTNPSFGKKWMYNEELQLSRKVSEKDMPPYIERGWKIGRVIKFNNYKICVICGAEFKKEKGKTCSPECLVKLKQQVTSHRRSLSGREEEFIQLYRTHKSINKALKEMGFSGNNSGWGRHAREILAGLA